MSAIYVRKFIENQRQEESEICANRHKQKLTKLGLDISKFDANYTKTIRNPSDRKLSDVEKILLSKELNFGIPSNGVGRDCRVNRDKKRKSFFFD